MSIIESTLSLNTLFVLHPDLSVLIHFLKERGYGPPNVPGIIAQKANVLINSDNQRKVIGVNSLSSETLAGGFQELIEVMEKDMGMDLNKSTFFYELIGAYRIKVEHNPLKEINSVLENSEIVRKINKAIGDDTALFSLRFVPKGKRPDSTEWFDIKIEPIFTIPNNMYFVSTIYRSRNRNKVVDFLFQLETKVTQIINSIGG